jgi:hypothetical protein
MRTGEKIKDFKPTEVGSAHVNAVSNRHFHPDKN